MILLKFLDEVVELNKNLIDDKLQAHQFNLYLDFNQDKLMNFIRKTGKYPERADRKCEDRGLFVEQAFIILDKSKNSQDPEIYI